jgi:hypothetical protein
MLPVPGAATATSSSSTPDGGRTAAAALLLRVDVPRHESSLRASTSTRRYSRPILAAVLVLAVAAAAAAAIVITVIRGLGQHGSGDDSCATASLTLVQTIPVGDFVVEPAAGSLATHEALAQLAASATATLDVTAMYVDLLGETSRERFNESEMAAFGAARGAAVFSALHNAAQRGVAMRLLLGTLNDPLNSTEVRTLLKQPNVRARTWDPKPWYGGGIMHLKMWHADGTAAYLGSANADWKSLAQVKELVRPRCSGVFPTRPPAHPPHLAPTSHAPPPRRHSASPAVRAAMWCSRVC